MENTNTTEGKLITVSLPKRQEQVTSNPIQLGSSTAICDSKSLHNKLAINLETMLLGYRIGNGYTPVKFIGLIQNSNGIYDAIQIEFLSGSIKGQIKTVSPVGLMTYNPKTGKFSRQWAQVLKTQTAYSEYLNTLALEFADCEIMG